ncbi:PIG-P-domain-containing protein [Podospora conica]|nr:PIG-P-domain-containing protein [Schizothecium conicum]
MSVPSEEEEEDPHHPLLSSENNPSGDESFSDSEDSFSDSNSQASSDSPRSGSPRRPPPTPFSQHHHFAPPFYGRPPTPLPPSPSLTSLLRPSRPTTPDQSDDDVNGGGITDTGGGGNASSVPHHPPLPRASPKVPTYEYYGFVLYLFSSLCFLIYLLWSYLPSPFLHALGIDYYPNRWWSLAIPSFLVMSYVYIYVALAAYNVEILTLGLGSLETVVDEAAKVAVVDGKGRIRGRGRRRGDRGLVGPGGGLDWRRVWNEGTDAVMDVPLAGVCEVLYGYGGGGVDDGEGDGGDVTFVE